MSVGSVPPGGKLPASRTTPAPSIEDPRIDAPPRDDPAEKKSVEKKSVEKKSVDRKSVETKSVGTAHVDATQLPPVADDAHIHASAVVAGSTPTSPIPLSARPHKGGASLFATLIAHKSQRASLESDTTPHADGTTAPLTPGTIAAVAYASEAFRGAGPRGALHTRTERGAKPGTGTPQSRVSDRTFLQSLQRFLGLEKHPTITRPVVDATQVATFRRATTRLVDRTKWLGATAEERALFIQATAEHLAHVDVKATRVGGRFVIEPHKSGSPLNVLAWTVKEKLGGSLVFDVDARMQGGLGAWHDDTRQLDLDIASVAFGRASAVAVHELHHASLDAGIEGGADPLLGFCLYSIDGRAMSSADLYTGQMSGQELSTFAKHQRMLWADEVGSSGAITEQNRHALLMFTRAIREVARNGAETSEKLLPELHAFTRGEASSVTFDVHSRGDVVAIFQDEHKGLHHLAQLQSSSPAQRARFEALKQNVPHGEAVRKEVAADLIDKLALSQTIADAMMDVERALFLELEKLTPGTTLSEQEQRAVKDLLAWPGYLVRVATDATKTLDERTAELARQKALAQARIAAAGTDLAALDARMNAFV